MFEPLAGGCLCGAVRYAVSLEPIDAGYCHCRLCQRASGAPVLGWLTVAIEGFRYLAGSVAAFQSSPHYQREFCGRCGTQLVFRRLGQAPCVDVTLASLDEPGRVVPGYHIWCASRIGWFETTDTLPRHAEEGPDVHDR